MSDNLSTVAIVGGGIGGLTSALALSEVGISSIVLERYSNNNDVGAGIQLSPNATRVLFQLGLETDLTPVSRFPSSMEWFDGETDKPLARFPISEYVDKAFDAPYLQIYRPDLMTVLKSACENKSCIEIRTGVSVETLRFIDDGVALKTSSGEIRADLCIGADGTNSSIRKYANDSFGKRLFAGFAYRAMIPLRQLDERYSKEVTRLWLNPSYHVVTYTVCTEPTLNCVFVIEADDVTVPKDTHRQRTTRKPLTDGIRAPSPLIRFLLERVPEDTLYRWPLYQFPPIPARCSPEHPLALTGDAWHTTFPFAGQGAALAIEDSVALAASLADARSDSPVESLYRYEESRIERIRQVQAISARNRTVYHLKNPILKLLRTCVAQAAYRRTAKQLFNYRDMSFN